MKAYILYFFIVCTFCISCSAKKKTISTVAAATAQSSSTRDGSSYENAIIIQATSETKGIAEEYAWIRDKYPNSKTQSQSLNNKDNKPYDIIHIVTDDGKQLAVYFDISNFFGKF